MDNNNINFKGRNFSEGDFSQSLPTTGQGYYLFLRFVEQDEPVTPKHTTPVFVRIAPNWANNLQPNDNVSGLCVECVGCFRKWMINPKDSLGSTLDIFGIYPTLKDCRENTNKINNGNNSGGSGGSTGGGSSETKAVYLTVVNNNRNAYIENDWNRRGQRNAFNVPCTLDEYISLFPPTGLIGCASNIVITGSNTIAQGFNLLSIGILQNVGSTVYRDYGTNDIWTVDEDYPHIKWDWINRFSQYGAIQYRHSQTVFGGSFQSWTIGGNSEGVDLIVDDIKSRIPGLSEVDISCPTSGGQGGGLGYPRARENGGQNDPDETFIHVPLSRYIAEIWAGSLNPSVEPIKIHETTADELFAMAPFFNNALGGNFLSNWGGMSESSTPPSDRLFRAHNIIDILLSKNLYDEGFPVPGKKNSNPDGYESLSPTGSTMGGSLIGSLSTSPLFWNTQFLDRSRDLIGDLMFTLRIAIHSFGDDKKFYVVVKEGATMEPDAYDVDYLPVPMLTKEYVTRCRDFYKINKHIVIEVENFSTIRKTESEDYPSDILDVAKDLDPYYYRFVYSSYFGITFLRSVGYVFSFVDSFSDQHTGIKHPYVIPETTDQITINSDEQVYDFSDTHVIFQLFSSGNSTLDLKHEEDGSYINYDIGTLESDSPFNVGHRCYSNYNWVNDFQHFIFPANRQLNLYYTPVGFGIPKDYYEKYAFYYMARTNLESYLLQYKEVTIQDILNAGGLTEDEINNFSPKSPQRYEYPEIYNGLKNLLSNEELETVIAASYSLSNNFNPLPVGFDINNPNINSVAPVFGCYWIPTMFSGLTIDSTEKSIQRTEFRIKSEHLQGQVRQGWNFLWYLVCKKIPIYILFSVDKYNADGYKILQRPDYFEQSQSYNHSEAQNNPLSESAQFLREFKPIYSERNVLTTKIAVFNYPLPDSENMIYQQSYFLGFFG